MVPKYPVDFVFPAQSHSFLSSVPLLLLSRQKFKNNGTEKTVNWSLQQFFILGKAPESESISFTVFLEEKSEKSIAANGDVEPLIAREPSGMEEGGGGGENTDDISDSAVKTAESCEISQNSR